MSRAERGESNLLADIGVASPPAAARNVTVENFLPQQRWQWGVVTFVLKFPEEKIHYRSPGLINSITDAPPGQANWFVNHSLVSLCAHHSGNLTPQIHT
jgi:hypothetical protein